MVQSDGLIDGDAVGQFPIQAVADNRVAGFCGLPIDDDLTGICCPMRQPDPRDFGGSRLQRKQREQSYQSESPHFLVL
jgi:hypothetical protein